MAEEKSKIVAIVSPPYEEAEDRLKYKFQKGRVSAVMPRVYDKKHHGNSQGQIGSLKSQSKEEPDFDITEYHKCGGDLYWYGCYEGDSYYKQFFDNSTYAHPAKISPLLVERIFKHLEHLGLLKEGMTVLDFMAGSARIPLMASLRGYKSIGVELEKHFTDMGEKNKKFAENKVGRKLDMEIMQGDSRQLSKLMIKSDVAVSSPPYFQSGGKSDSEDNTLNQRNPISLRNNYSLDSPNQIGNLPYVAITSPPYQDAISNQSEDDNLQEIAKRQNWSLSKHCQPNLKNRYSQNPNNIGNLKDKGFIGITSPPYAGQLTDEGGNQEINQVKNRPHPYTKDKEDRTQIGNFTRNEWGEINDIGNLKDTSFVGITSPPFLDQNNRSQSDQEWRDKAIESGRLPKMGSACSNTVKYSDSKENIGNLKDTNFVGITSPPYDNKPADQRKIGNPNYDIKQITEEPYYFYNKNNKENNIGADACYYGGTENYLSAMLQVYKEASKVCPVICTVTKNPTRAGKLRRLDLDTAKLLELAGYRIIDYHRAVLFKTHEQATLTGETSKVHKGRISFFKRLHMAKGGIAAQWEDVLIGVKA